MSLLGKWFGFTCDEIFDEALSEFDLGAFDEAIEAFERCLQDDNADVATVRLSRFYIAESHAQLGKSDLRNGNPIAALRNFEAALRLFPNYPDLNLNAARSCYALGLRSRAREFLDRSLEINPRYPEALLLDGALLYDQGRFDEGLDRAEHAMELDPSLGMDRLRQIQARHREGERQTCAKALSALAMTVQGDATLHARVADSLFRDGMLEEAVEEYETAARLAPGQAEIQTKLGRVLVVLGRPSEALEHLRTALRINPASPDAYAQAGLAYRLLGNGLEAIAAFQKAVTLCPDHPVATQELRRVRGYAS